MNVIDTASTQYANRPKDERFESLPALIANAREDKAHSLVKEYNTKDLAAVVRGDSVVLASPKGEASFTHWSFGQTCRMVGAPAGYVRDLPPYLIAANLNHGFQHTPSGTVANILIRLGDESATVRACTSDSYGRLWDEPLYSSVNTMVAERDTRWGLPPTWSGEKAGAYRGDRDSFLILTNGGSIVTDPTLSGSSDGSMFRGILIRNSEVGASSVVIESILYRYICGNHMLWGAAVDRQYRRRHFGNNVLRDVVREIGTIAFKWANASVERDNAIIRSLVDHELAHTKEAVVDELRKMGASKEQAENAYSACEIHERVSPRSMWGAVQGLTRLSQDTQYQDERYELDKIAATILARGAKLVAA